jgi:hypothetical protein
MQFNDLVNGLFELFGAVLTWINVKKLYKDKTVKGVYWPVWAFFSCWGLWNLYYYPSVAHYFSFFSGIFLVSGNITWSIMACYYIYNESKFTE